MKWIYRRLQRSIKPDKDGSMRYLVAGLGNFGKDYEETRHNIGFKVVDKLLSEKDITTKAERFGDVGHFRLKNKEVYLLKPSTFMNRSGRAIYYWLQKLKIPTNRLLVIVDDVHLPFGIFRLRKSGSDGGHNGLKSIQEHLVSTHYPRFRIGIGNEFSNGYKTDFVLGNWTEKEQHDLPVILGHAGKVVQKFVLEGIDRTMSIYNRKTGPNLIED